MLNSMLDAMFNSTPDSTFDPSQVLAVIPVLNEEGTIAEVIQALKNQGVGLVRVVDNGSTDHSAIAAQTAGAEVLYESKRGYGQACWTGIQDLPDSIHWILFCDGDGSEDLTQLPQFWQGAQTADFVLGDRRSDATSRAALAPAQQFGSGLAAHLIQWGWGHRYHDLGPLRLIRRSALEAIEMQDRGFGWTVEMQVRAVELGLSIQEIPIHYRDRQGGQSKISGTIRGSIKAGHGILSTLGKLYSRRWSHPKPPALSWLILVSALLVVAGSALTVPFGDFFSGTALYPFWFGIGVMGLGFVLSWAIADLSPIWFWGVSVGARLLLLPMTPSDDVWRYLWEGYIQTLGFSPYALAPNAPELEPFRTAWWGLMNHPDVSAIYPPVAQMGFRFLALIGPTVLLFKLALVAADLGVCYLLGRRFGYGKALAYAWNPLVLYSFAGGAHYDTWFIFPLVAAWLLFEQRRWWGSGFWLGVSVGVKWISLPVLAFVVWRSPWRRSLIILAVASVPLLLTVPFYCSPNACPLIPVQSTFVTHGRSAELIPYLIQNLWPLSRTQNWPLGIPLVAIIAGLMLFSKQLNIFTETYLCSLLLLSPIVHAWYFTWLVPFSVASGNWGTRLVSLSAFVYFALPHRIGVGDPSWILSDMERSLLWLPFIVGLLWTLGATQRKQPFAKIEES